MNSSMRDQMMNLINSLAQVKVAEAPTYQVMVSLSRRLKSFGIPPEVAEHLVARMPISVSQTAAEDEELVNRLIEANCDLIVNMLNAIRQDFETDPYEILMLMASQFEIKMEF